MLKIAHLSDIHLRCKYSGTYMDEIIRQRTMPTDYFITALKEIYNADYDLIVLTGDLVHEGSAQDYTYLKELLDTYACGKPVLHQTPNNPTTQTNKTKRAFMKASARESLTSRYIM